MAEAEIRARALSDAADFIAAGILGEGAPDYSYTDSVCDRTLRGVVDMLRGLAEAPVAAPVRLTQDEACGCGCPLVMCPGCAEPRCLHCDPFCQDPSC